MRFAYWRSAVFIAAAIWPLLWLYEAWSQALGPDPGKVLVDRQGLGTLILLLITLCMTPLHKVTGWAGWIDVLFTNADGEQLRTSAMELNITRGVTQ